MVEFNEIFRFLVRCAMVLLGSGMRDLELAAVESRRKFRCVERSSPEKGALYADERAKLHRKLRPGVNRARARTTDRALPSDLAAPCDDESF
jgi:hypothetical protein